MLFCSACTAKHLLLHLQRAEHNEGMLATLEEVSLHQQGIERIELLGHACRALKILYLQSNVISKLENLHRLKARSRNCACLVDR